MSMSSILLSLAVTLGAPPLAGALLSDVTCYFLSYVFVTQIYVFLITAIFIFLYFYLSICLQILIYIHNCVYLYYHLSHFYINFTFTTPFHTHIYCICTLFCLHLMFNTIIFIIPFLFYFFDPGGAR